MSAEENRRRVVNQINEITGAFWRIREAQIEPWHIEPRTTDEQVEIMRRSVREGSIHHVPSRHWWSHPPNEVSLHDEDTAVRVIRGLLGIGVVPPSHVPPGRWSGVDDADADADLPIVGVDRWPQYWDDADDGRPDEDANVCWRCDARMGANDLGLCLECHNDLREESQ